MICQHCKKDIEEVRVFSECSEIGTLRGNDIVGYSGVEDISDEATDVECPECHRSIQDQIENY